MPQKQRKTLIVTLVALAVITIGTALVYLVSTSSPKEPAGSASFREAPALGLKDADGKAHSLGELFQGGAKIAVIHFWAHWCPPCLEEIPKFTDFARSPEAAAYRFMAVSEDANWEDAQKSLPATGLPATMTSVIDPDNKISEIYGTFQFPETYIIRRAPSGRIEILTKWVGPQNWGSTEISTALARLASDHE